MSCFWTLTPLHSVNVINVAVGEKETMKTFELSVVEFASLNEPEPESEPPSLTLSLSSHHNTHQGPGPTTLEQPVPLVAAVN
jgi:hypothetical protein